MSGAIRAICCCGGGGFPAGDPNCPTLFQRGTRTISLNATTAGYVVGNPTITGPLDNGCPAFCQENYPDSPPVYVKLDFRKCIMFTLDLLPVGNFPAKFVIQPINQAASIKPCVVTPICPGYGGGAVQDLAHAGGGVSGTWDLTTTGGGTSYTLTQTSETPTGVRLVTWDISLSGPSCQEWSTFWSSNAHGLFPSWTSAGGRCSPSATTGKWHFWGMRMSITQNLETVNGIDCTNCTLLTPGFTGSEGWTVWAIYGRPVTVGFNPLVPYTLSGNYSLLYSAAEIPYNTILEQTFCSLLIRDTSQTPAYDRVLAPPCNPPGNIDCSLTQPRTGLATSNRSESCSNLAASQYGFTIPNILTAS
jgi:hypothetical protein